MMGNGCTMKQQAMAFITAQMDLSTKENGGEIYRMVSAKRHGKMEANTKDNTKKE
jgi:hypothetical protein